MSLELLESGSLHRPGPLGRGLRLLLGLLCLYALRDLASISSSIINNPIGVLPGLALMLVVMFCAFNYVINIGYSKNWGSFPLLIVLAYLGIVALVGYLMLGNANSQVLGLSLFIWLVYLFAHLGVSFILAAVIATPGCEMRAIPELVGKIANKDAKEHHCPAGFITALDRWERNGYKIGK